MPQQDVLDDQVAVPLEQSTDGGQEERDDLEHAPSIADSGRIRAVRTVLPLLRRFARVLFRLA